MAIRPPRTSTRWLSTSDAAREIGSSDWLIRDRIEQGVLPANVVTSPSGSRRVYRIAREDWERFKARYVGLAGDPRFERRDR